MSFFYTNGVYIIIRHSMYAYTQNNPVMSVDPSGYQSETEGSLGSWIVEHLIKPISEGLKYIGKEIKDGIRNHLDNPVFNNVNSITLDSIEGVGDFFLGVLEALGVDQSVTKIISGGLTKLINGLNIISSFAYQMQNSDSFWEFTSGFLLDVGTVFIPSLIITYYSVGITAHLMMINPLLGIAGVVALTVASSIASNEMNKIREVILHDIIS